ncbi:glycosyltransferase family 39 protein [Streptomyces sp. NPDC005865]|uniref:glycosyltransferase family 39 protein n=1 Tax=Streptomyces sp. NPDC005865 TaxID=3155453 RepID=UPI0033DB2724
MSTALPGVLLTLGLGLWGIRRDGTMWLDEMATYEASRRGLGELWRTLGNVDAVHGLYYLLVHALFGATGDADPLLVLRIPSVLAMGAATAGVALLGRRLAGARAGALAGVVFALTPAVQRFAQEGRSYAVVCALVVWATYALVDAVAKEGRRARRAWFRYGALMLVACLLHEFAVFALAGHALTVPRAARRRWAVAAAAVCTGLAPLVVVSRHQQGQVSWIRVDTGMYADTLTVCLLGAGCAVLIGRLPRGPAKAPVGLVRVALTLLVAPVGVLMLLTPVKPLFLDRYVLYCLCGLALLVGGLLDRALRGRRWHGVVAVITAAAALAFVLPEARQLRDPALHSGNADAAATARAVRAVGRSGDAVVYMPAHHRGWVLPTPDTVAGLRDIALDSGPDASHTLYGVEAPAHVIRDRMTAESRIVFVTDRSAGAASRAEREATKLRVVQSLFEKCRTWQGPGPLVTLYARPGHC